DTWARDHGAITVEEDGQWVLLDFMFNGWGLKFPAFHDNLITGRLYEQGVFGSWPLRRPGMVLEGGGIESDGQGTILTTAECLLSPNRNPHLSQADIERQLSEWLGATHILWLHHGYLAGDDTDSHIDTLARLCPNDTIAYVRCGDPDDEHYAALQLMENELRAMRTKAGAPFRLTPLPWPQACYAADGFRLPATYANFLVINGAVLVPTYGAPQDDEALEIIGNCFPGRAVIGINCRMLIEQHGSLHCITMQYPHSAGFPVGVQQ
ncbi:MAG: agmatine deiminase family protein, partial [Phaeodactylibacter sp.]|nr:agmatine deiminase family protein [Phaeodactylibacter sp.]